MAAECVNHSATEAGQGQGPQEKARGPTFDVLPVSSVRDLGVYIDSDVAMRSHVTATV